MPLGQGSFRALPAQVPLDPGSAAQARSGHGLVGCFASYLAARLIGKRAIPPGAGTF